MLDAFVIFTRGGVVLFSEQLVALRGEPVEALVRECLLTERAGGAAFSYATDGAAYALKWAFHNEKGLVFVAVRRDAASRHGVPWLSCVARAGAPARAGADVRGGPAGARAAAVRGRPLLARGAQPTPEEATRRFSCVAGDACWR
jgi:signal recognition particle receptor subunit alpha